MSQTFYILGSILTIGFCYVAFYVVQQIVKRRRNIDIPDFLVGGDNPVNRGSSSFDIDPDPPNICRISEKK